MDYEKKCKEKLERAQKVLLDCTPEERKVVEYIFPELAESEDEKIKETIYDCLYRCCDNGVITKKQREKCIAWLEKQGSEPNWCHHKVDLSDCSEEYRKAYYDGWNNCNMQHSQCKSELDDVLKCLINGMKFYYEDNKDATWGTDKWSMPVKHIIEVLENQGKQKPVDVRTTGYWHVEDVEQKPTDKVEPKFHEGEWVVNTVGDTNQVVKVLDDGYTLDDNTFISNSWATEHYHLWTIQDAKEGDVLSWDDSKCIALFKKIFDKDSFNSYGFVGHLTGAFELGLRYHDIEGAHPASKEQRDLLFQKMREAGFEWDAEKKELKEIEQYGTD